MQPIAFVDLETTGATATADRITEIGIVQVDATGTRQWSTLVNPETPIPRFIQSLTGITDAMVATAPTFDSIAGEVAARLDGRLFVAHNARFDYGFLKNEFRRLGQDFRATVLCTVKLSRRLYPQQRHHNLDALIARHGLVPGDRHRALADADLLHQFWTKLHDSHPVDLLRAALDELTARPSLPSKLDPAIVDTLPEAPGVYLFYGENALPLYVGKAKNIRSRVLSHFAGDHASAKEMSLSQQVQRIDWILTGGEIGALLQEAHLIKTLQPSHNRQLRRNGELCSIALTDRGEGAITAEIVSAREPDFARRKNLHGLFKTAKEATRTLEEIASAHGLCHALLGLEEVKSGKPCFSHQLKKCRGACVGAESPPAHSLRLAEALGHLKLKTWPFPGPAYLREADELMLVDNWCHLGTAGSDAEMEELLAQGRAQFDRDIYRILIKVADRMRPIAH